MSSVKIDLGHVIHMGEIMSKGQSHLTLPRLNGLQSLLQSYVPFYFIKGRNNNNNNDTT
jgi:hypothetical protein